MTDVTVIGLGPMGQAMVGAFLRADRSVTVWNRTPSRAQALVAAGASPAATPAEAVRASPVSILSLTDYRAMDAVLDQVDLHGRALVNLSSDTPDRSRRAARWAQQQGAQFLTGGIMVPAPMVGTPVSYGYYSGPEQILDQHEALLRLIGEPRHLGSDPGLAQLFHQANLAVFLTALSGLVNATALVTAAGVPATQFLPGALQILGAVPAMVGEGAELGRRIEGGEHPGDRSTVSMMGATALHVVQTAEATGVASDLPKAVLAQYRQAIEAGLGDRDWTALYEVVRPTAGPDAARRPVGT